MNQARNDFFQAVAGASSDDYIVRQNERSDRLEHTMIKEALQLSGLGNHLKSLAEECQDELQLGEAVFKTDWFERKFAMFPVKLITSEALFSKDVTLVDAMLYANKQPHFKAYFKAVGENMIDDTSVAVCCVFRVGGRLQCIHNLLSLGNPFANMPPDASATALVWHTSNGILSLQWYKQFLQSIGNEWAKHD